jgi:hypothetical protein
MMRDCADGNMRDLLPDYVHDALSAAERATVAAHLEGCADCAAEVGLISAATRAFPAGRVDVANILKALPAAPRRASQRTFVSRGLRVAAAIALVAIGAYSVVVMQGKFNPAQRQVASVPLPPTGTPVTAAPMESVAPAVVPPAPTKSPSASAARGQPAISFGGGLSDLTDDQLDTLLGELDGLEALPSTEPETHITPILPPPAEEAHNAR